MLILSMVFVDFSYGIFCTLELSAIFVASFRFIPYEKLDHIAWQYGLMKFNQVAYDHNDIESNE